MTTATRSAGVRLVRGVGWLLVVAGAVILLYVVYLLWFTGLETERAQGELADAWTNPVEATIPDPGDDDRVDEGGHADERDDAASAGQPDAPPDPGGAYAAMWFERDGQRIIHDDPLYVVEGVTLDVLRAGPGHYPDSDRPGGAGNLAVAGHRTTYGAPFWSVNELREGDTIHVVDRDRREWVYDYREQRVVQPTDTWVVDADPLATGAPTITLTTCHPRGSAAQRLVVWGELRGDPHDDRPGGERKSGEAELAEA